MHIFLNHDLLPSETLNGLQQRTTEHHVRDDPDLVVERFSTIVLWRGSTVTKHLISNQNDSI